MSSMEEKGFLWGPEMNQLEVRNTWAVINSMDNKSVLKKRYFSIVHKIKIFSHMQCYPENNFENQSCFVISMFETPFAGL